MRSFFVTIDRNILVELLTKDIIEPEFRNLVRSLYLTDLRIGARKIHTSNNVSIPTGKSWFDQAPEKGLPIGNLTSQFGANVYLNALDQWIQRELHPMGYIRYMDDLILLGKTKEELAGLDLKINDWLNINRKQSLNHDKTKLLSLEKGILFLGHWCVQTNNPKEPLEFYLKPNVQWEFIKSIKKLEECGVSEKLRCHPLSFYTEDEALRSMISSVNSRLGHIKHSRSWLFRKKTLEKLMFKTTNHIPDELGGSYSALKVNRTFQKIKR